MTIAKPLFSMALGCLTLAVAAVRLYQEPARITVRVLNPAHVPARTAAQAERAAASIFRRAGVELDWVDCDVPLACRGELGALEFWLHLREPAPAVLHGDALGYAVLTHVPRNEGGYAAVSWQAVRTLADSMELDPAPILGVSIAHELGHVLLGSHSHSRDGVMAAHLRTPQLRMAVRGELLFDDAQAESIRREIRRRTGALE